MKKTVWEIDGGCLTLEYHHASGEMFIEERKNSMNSKREQIALDDECVSNLILALGDLKLLRTEGNADKLISDIGSAA
jgi:hypothetical protein